MIPHAYLLEFRNISNASLVKSDVCCLMFELLLLGQQGCWPVTVKCTNSSLLQPFKVI